VALVFDAVSYFTSVFEKVKERYRIPNKLDPVSCGGEVPRFDQEILEHFLNVNNNT